jgi:excisionase family DNA binding protein
MLMAALAPKSQLAVTAALEAAANQFAAMNTIESEIPASLRPFIIEASRLASSDELIGPEEAAQRLNVSRATIYNWIESRRLIGWRLTRQGTLIPAEQIVGSGELVAGIEQILQLIPEPRAAWRFLAEESQLFAKPQRPIDTLKAGKTNEVIAAARVGRSLHMTVLYPRGRAAANRPTKCSCDANLRPGYRFLQLKAPVVDWFYVQHA